MRIRISITRGNPQVSKVFLITLKLLLLLLVGIFPRDVIGEDALFVNHNCSGSNYTYSQGSTFQQNLNRTLLSVLPASASDLSLVRFSNMSIGEGIDRVYALYLCRGDVDSQTCHDCVEAAATNLVHLCQFLKEGVVWYEECLLRYANRTIFSLEEVTPKVLDYNHTSMWSSYHLDSYNHIINSEMDGLIKQAAFNLSLLGFATRKINLSSPNQTWRGLAQCTPDILGDPCETCLTTAFRQWDSWPNTKIFLPSCLIRFDLYGSLPPPPPLPGPPGPHSRKILLIALPSTIALLLLLGALCFWKSCYHPRQPQSNHPIANLPTEDREMSFEGELTDFRTAGAKRLSYLEVESMTSSFQRRLGEGGFGYVYYGRLMDGNRSKEVAVKVLSKDAPKQFSTEIAVFGKISHKNLVSLIGYCEEPDKLALVYEYMAGGDLKALLSGSDSLNWKTRLEIAIDSAQGLDYLHHGCRPAIVHRDVKTPNILLNQHLRAKIADFGFSKIFPDEYVSTLSTRVIGTPGYVDLQYHLTGQLNERSDVYSFGVVLLELITGKEPIIGNETNLVQWVRPMLERGELESIVDPRLPQVENRSSLWRATDLAMDCVKNTSVERPTMSLIVTELKECLAMEMDGTTISIRPHPNSMEIVNVSLSTVMGPTAR